LIKVNEEHSKISDQGLQKKYLSSMKIERNQEIIKQEKRGVECQTDYESLNCKHLLNDNKFENNMKAADSL
jgi:hypothetical protein